MDYIPEAGDIVWLDFDPQSGHEQAGHRPALVVSTATYNGRTGLMLCCPVTSQIKNYPFEVVISGARRNVALADQIKSLDWRARHASEKGNGNCRRTGCRENAGEGFDRLTERGLRPFPVLFSPCGRARYCARRPCMVNRLKTRQTTVNHGKNQEKQKNGAKLSQYQTGPRETSAFPPSEC
ncbi:mRNA interferase MazF [Leclercia adecarboxylata]|uniref:mRNA interferase MazF n=1 Tax=Leclercia adecarboxylata TaxID=83655 RepID=A0A4U9HV79_9ENTR|nr:mRNA interferase MazF [Leclercia adecarboxylata]